jgi:hypothetical protein
MAKRVLLLFVLLRSQDLKIFYAVVQAVIINVVYFFFVC